MVGPMMFIQNHDNYFNHHSTYAYHTKDLALLIHVVCSRLLSIMYYAKRTYSATLSLRHSQLCVASLKLEWLGVIHVSPYHMNVHV